MGGAAGEGDRKTTLEAVRSVVFKESETLDEECFPKISGYDFNQGVDLMGLLRSMASTGFQASNLGDAIDVVNEMLDWRLSREEPTDDCSKEEREPAYRGSVKCKIFLGFTSNLVSSGVRDIIRFLVEHQMVDCLVTTAGGIEEDLIKCLAPTYKGDFSLPGAYLRSKGLNRIGNLLVPNDNYCKFEDWINPIFDKMLQEQAKEGVIWTPSKVIARLGKEISDESSYLYWAHKAHTKRRNRLEHKRMNSLVFVMYNMKLNERTHRRRQVKRNPLFVDESQSDDEWIAEHEGPCLPTDLSWLDKRLEDDDEHLDYTALNFIHEIEEDTTFSTTATSKRQKRGGPCISSRLHAYQRNGVVECKYRHINKNGIPVYCPALTDGSLGDMLYVHSIRNPGLLIDIVQDIRAMNGEAVHAGPRKTGIIILGGGLPKHHICNANMMRNGADYAVFINTAQEFDGSDSGAQPDEAVSWGKIKGAAKTIKVHCDATIAFPLLVAGTFATRLQEAAGTSQQP